MVGLIREVGGDRQLATLVDRLDRHGDGYRQLGPLDLDGVKAIGRWYSTDVDDLPAESILRSSGGIPAAIHELVTRWAGDEARRRLEAAAAWLAEGRGRQAAGLRFADNVIAAHLGRMYDAGRVEELGDGCALTKDSEAFEEADAAYFFGREQLVGELAARTVGFGLLGVVGPSGSGKSSVVLAGLIPSLRAGLLPGSERWDHAVLRPGAASERGARRCTGPTPVRHARRRATRPGCRPVRGGLHHHRRRGRTGRLHRPAGRRWPTNPVWSWSITVRADFTGHCAPYPELADLLAANLVLVGPMTADQLRRVIEAPARRVGIRVESSLVDALVAEVADEPGGLPLLSTALVQLWQARDGGLAPLRRVRAQRRRPHGSGPAGGVLLRAALGSGARSGQNGLPPARRRPGEGDSAVRRRVSVSEFDVDEDPTAAAVLLVLTRDRLLTRDDEQVEIAHEALIREWPRLRGWLQEDTAGRQLRSHITQSARQWAERGREPGGSLPRGPAVGCAGLVAQRRPRPQRAGTGVPDREPRGKPAAARAGTSDQPPAADAAGRERRFSWRSPSWPGCSPWCNATRPSARDGPGPGPRSPTPSGSARWPRPSPTSTSLSCSPSPASGWRTSPRPAATCWPLAAQPRRLPIHPALDQRDHRPRHSAPMDSSWPPATQPGAVRFEDLKTWRPSGSAVQLPAPVPPLGLCASRPTVGPSRSPPARASCRSSI